MGNKCRQLTAQSATEYLMIYGWTVLIIAVVILVFYQLGVFGNSNFVPRAAPGSCTVERTAAIATLEGLCQGEYPEYVMAFNSSGKWNFNCASQGSCIAIPSPDPNESICNFTITAWSYDSGMGTNGSLTGPFGVWIGGSGANPAAPSLGGVFSVYNGSPSDGAVDIEYNDTIIRYELRNESSRNQLFYQGNFKGTWIFTALTLTNGTATAYYDGAAISQPSKNIGCIRLTTGVIGTWDRNFAGQIADIQIYNTSLTPSVIKALYIEGIGGAPLNLYNIVAWYPLNGNAYDYSGDNRDGTINLISYRNQWTSNYQPT